MALFLMTLDNCPKPPQFWHLEMPFIFP